MIPVSSASTELKNIYSTQTEYLHLYLINNEHICGTYKCPMTNGMRRLPPKGVYFIVWQVWAKFGSQG